MAGGQINIEKGTHVATEADNLGLGFNALGQLVKIDENGAEDVVGDGAGATKSTELSDMPDQTAFDNAEVGRSLEKNGTGYVFSSNKSLVSDDEIKKLSTYPSQPEESTDLFLRDDMTFAAISSGINPTSSNLYATDEDSVTTGYKVASYEVETLAVNKSIVALTSDTIYYGDKYLFDNQFFDTIIQSGQWEMHLYGNVNSSAGDSRVILRAFVYSLAGVETELFEATSVQINETTAGTTIMVNYNSPSIAILSTDRLGFQIGFKTTSAVDKTFTYIIGDGLGSHLNAPFALRHSQLRNKNEEDSFQHITLDQKNSLISTPSSLIAYSRKDGAWFDVNRYGVRVIDSNTGVFDIDMYDYTDRVVQVRDPATALAAFTLTKQAIADSFIKHVVFDNQTSNSIVAASLAADVYENGLTASFTFPTGKTRIYYHVIDDVVYAGLVDSVIGQGQTTEESSLSIVSNNVNIDFNSKNNFNALNILAVSAAITITRLNVANARFSSYIFNVTNFAASTVTFPDLLTKFNYVQNFEVAAVRWDSTLRKLTFLENGIYEISEKVVDGNYFIKIGDKNV